MPRTIYPDSTPIRPAPDRLVGWGRLWEFRIRLASERAAEFMQTGIYRAAPLPENNIVTDYRSYVQRNPLQRLVDEQRQKEHRNYAKAQAKKQQSETHREWYKDGKSKTDTAVEPQAKAGKH